MRTAPLDPNDDSLLHEVLRTVDRIRRKPQEALPNWEPLESAIPVAWLGGFMWMGSAYHLNRRLECYKHGITRRSLNLDAALRSYRYAGGGLYEEIPLSRALDYVFADLEEMGLQRCVAYDETFILKRNRRLRQLGYTILS